MNKTGQEKKSTWSNFGNFVLMQLQHLQVCQQTQDAWHRSKSNSNTDDKLIMLCAHRYYNDILVSTQGQHAQIRETCHFQGQFIQSIVLCREVCKLMQIPCARSQ
jgi:hypothetical protein